MEKTRFYWCLGRDIPVEIHIGPSIKLGMHISEVVDAAKRAGSFDRARLGFVMKGAVTALNPREIKAGRPQGKGLFLRGAILDRDNIQKVVTEHNGINVTKHVKMSFGPGL